MRIYYICVMYVRRKKNRSGSISIVVVDNHGGKFKELHTVGIAADESESMVYARKDESG